METPILHELKSIRATLEPDVYIADVDLTDMEGQRYECEYVSRPDDTFGLAPTVREAVDDWIADEKPVDPYVPPAPAVPMIISRRQFYAGLAAVEKISQGEALAAMKTGSIPTAIQVIVDGMTDDDAKYEAEMKLIGASDFRRDDPLVMVFAVTQGMTEGDVDDFWRLSASL